MSASRAMVVGIGEVLWDLLPTGARIGGAPANFACHASQLSAAASMVSGVGQDNLGRQAIEALAACGVATDQVKQNSYNTGSVDVTLDDQGHPAYTIATDVAWDHLAWSDELAELAAATDAVCFGSLGQRSEESRRTIQHFVGSTPHESWRIFDVNLRPPFVDDIVLLQSLALANVLKLNDEELPILASMCGLSGSEADLTRRLASHFELEAVALTCGSRGALLLRHGEISEQPAVSTNIVDTVGAGDAYAAALAMGLLANRELDAINQTACRIAAFVCSQSGAVPVLPDELVALH